MHFGTAWHRWIPSHVFELFLSKCICIGCSGYYFRWWRDCVSVQKYCYDKTALILSYNNTEEISHAFIFLWFILFFSCLCHSVVNISGRLLTEAKWHNHITPILSSLYWLPLSSINLKIYVIDHYMAVFQLISQVPQRKVRKVLDIQETVPQSKDWGKLSLQFISSFSDQEIYISAFHLW